MYQRYGWTSKISRKAAETQRKGKAETSESSLPFLFFASLRLCARSFPLQDVNLLAVEGEYAGRHRGDVVAAATIDPCGLHIPPAGGTVGKQRQVVVAAAAEYLGV